MKALSAATVGSLLWLVTPFILAQTPSVQGMPSTGQRAPSEQMPAVRLGTNLVIVPVTVMDPYDRFVTGLRKEHFEIYDEKIKQEIVFFSEEDAPLSIGIIFDVSGSMREKITRARAALRRFLDTSHPDDEFFVIAFNHRVQLVQDFTMSTETIMSKLMLIAPEGRTALYDAAYLGIEKVRQGKHARKALLIISDGQDNSSRYTYGQLRDLVKESDVQIYAIGIFGLNERATSNEALGRSILEEITSLTGGRAFFPDTPVELDDVLTRIALELRHQYSLGFYPTNISREGEWRRIRVRVNPPRGLPRLTVRAREGYYATSPQQ
ncbi:MAG: VWA domain-containing protein [Blastocatellia bacterium]|nr:VWA domain-containing protein [Blastocatellia bacterium]MCS7156474.1 VWA domain-containing protein [Blastocatellia bacterium]MCX7751785.1 VWA domain-containing protein [Blastocatellia bacterium]MDW8168887.1 VWA domain-containing protein [Acidobacteriota bacterium]MDW8256647.1 VWA domain-containing protein [Acidobacteriota bacterium]